MANIFVNIKDSSGKSTIQGESTVTGYLNQIECAAMRHVVYLPVIRASSRVQGSSRHGPVALTHAVDKATPHLKQAAMTGENIGTVQIKRVRTVSGALTAVETITLTDATVVRIDVDTPVSAATLEPSEELMETFYLDYSKIEWSARKIVNDRLGGAVEGQWPAPVSGAGGAASG